MSDDAFIESQETSRRSTRSIKLPLKENGAIDWENASEKNTAAFVEAIKVDPNGILQNIQEEAGATVTSETEGLSDATVVAAANLVMVIEAIALSVFPVPRFFPVLHNLAPIVAVKACAVSRKELEPIMEPSKRLIQKYIPDKYLSQDWQDIAVIAEHLGKISGEKFAACLKLANEIERMKQSGGTANGPNGRVVIDAEPTKQ